MTRKTVLILLCIAAGLSACAAGRDENAVLTGPRVLMSFEAGPSYQFTHWSGLWPLTIRPQMAAWLETADGTFVATIFVTEKAAHNSWISASSRPEALPVWRAKSGSAAVDAVSGATPQSGAERGTAVPAGLPAGEYVVMLEVNSSYDFNAAYPESGAGVNGQPSLVFSGRIAIGTPGSEAVLAPVGTGSPDGSGGSVKPGMDGLTTALQIIANPRARFLEQ